MINEDFGRFLEGILRKDRTVGRDFESQFVVVGFLVNAEILHGVFHVLDRSVD